MSLSEDYAAMEDLHPIDIVETLAEHHAWEFDRVTDDQIAMAQQKNPGVSGPADMDGFAAKTFDTHDVDKDGVISRAEWDARVEAHFARLDKNGDGMIEREEAAGTQQGQKKGD